jgi:Glyoxalase-like domain
MACRLTELVLDSHDPERLASFWCEVLGYVVLERVGDDVEIGPADVGFGGPQPTIVFNRMAESNQGKLRLHIDVSPTDREQDAELSWLIAAGATDVDIGQTGEESWHVLADPEGNEFCLLRRRVTPIQSDPQLAQQTGRPTSLPRGPAGA